VAVGSQGLKLIANRLTLHHISDYTLGNGRNQQGDAAAVTAIAIENIWGKLKERRSVAIMEAKHKPGEHPNSLANLNYRGGRSKAFGVEKKQRYLTITDEGWEGIQLVAKAAGCGSVSDLLEKIGRGQIKLPA